MYILDVLLNSQLVVAMASFGLLAAIGSFCERRVRRYCADKPRALWRWEHLGVPFARAALVLSFLYFSYPALFGLREAPGIARLLAADEARASTILGVLYVLALLAPVTPIFYNHPEFVLPMQGILATAFLFKWMTTYLYMTVTFWPGGDLALAMLLTSYLAHRLGRLIRFQPGSPVDGVQERRGFDAPFTHVLTLMAQLPVIVIYAAGLGRQIAI